MQVVLHASLIQIVGIVPTLILAQVGLGRCAQDVEIKFTTALTRNYYDDKPKAPLSPFTSNSHIWTEGHADKTLVSENWPAMVRSDQHSTWSKGRNPLSSEWFTDDYHIQSANEHQGDPESGECDQRCEVDITDVDYTAKEVSSSVFVS